MKDQAGEPQADPSPESEAGAATSIAIIGMAGRYPGASSADEFWDNLCRGVDSVSRFSSDELEDNFPQDVRERPDFVKARSVLPDVDMFEAGFFGMMPKEAALTDPQQRVFLECCWEALENAGYDPANYDGSIGVYAGSGFNTYLWRNVLGDQDGISRFCSDFQVGSYAELVGALPDLLATRVCYKLNLRGPGVAVQSACSTSLLAIAQSCQALLNYQCDMVLSGGVSITFPQRRGYLGQEGGMVSPTGVCRPFDAGADGTVFGSGAGVVVLKRLEDAIRDRDHIQAVIAGFGVNNDGADKVGFVAPSVAGQAESIRQAHDMAGICADQLDLVEAHGTGTPLGDPIEFAGLVHAFRETTDARNYCAIGSVKGNIGHLDAAAGVTSVIKTALSLERELIPPLTNFESPNPHLDVASSPFKFLTDATPWQRQARPRMAGVSSFGVGGTNVHLVMAEAPEVQDIVEDDGMKILPLSARTPTALDAARHQLAEHLKANPTAPLADAAWTLQTGRRAFAHRTAVVASDTASAIETLQKAGASGHKSRSGLPLAFMFPGQGSQYAGMGRQHFESEEVYAAIARKCLDLLEPELATELEAALFSGSTSSDDETSINDTRLAQPAIFITEYALARQWMVWGVQPCVMVGHSVGEFVAACLAGVMSIEDALKLVAARGRLMQELPRGSMLSVRLPAAELKLRLSPDLAIAAINGPGLCVAAGPDAAIDALAQELGADDIICKRLATSHAFHSQMMDPAVPSFLEMVSAIALKSPSIRIISSVTGAVLTDAEACDPHYWADHLRATVNFSAAVSQLRNDEKLALLELGPGVSLATLARQHAAADKAQPVVSAMPPAGAGSDERLALHKAVAALWSAGIDFDWTALNGANATRRRRIPLPTYPFERQRQWVDPPQPTIPVRDLPQLQEASTDIQSISSSIPADEHNTMQDNSEAQSAASQTDSDKALEQRIFALFEDVSGLSLSDSDPNESFVDWGCDSLLLTQAARAVQNEFGVKIAFRQLMGEQGTAASLAAYLAPHLPEPPKAEPVKISAPPAIEAQPQAATDVSVQMVTASPAVVDAPVIQNGAAVTDPQVERIMRDQLTAFNQVISGQLDALKVMRSVPQPAMIAAPAPTVLPTAAQSQAVAPVVATSPSNTSLSKSISAPDAPVSTAAESFGLAKRSKAASSNELTMHQRTHLDALIERVQARAPNSKESTQATRKVLADPRVVAGFREEWKEIVVPVVVNRSKGSRLWDVDGNEYIDLLNGFGPIMFGHRPEFVERAVEAQLKEGLEIGPQTPLAGEIAEMFCEMTGNERMTFCNTGSEAVMAAFRLARTVTGRDKIVSFSGGYHGMFDEVLISSKRGGGEPGALPIAPGIPRDSVSNMIVLEHASDRSLEWLRAHAGEVAAVIVEPVQSRSPHIQPIAFLKELRKITEKSGTALIFDEVVTGFRTHPGGCQALFDIRSDMATYGKVLGGGLPIGVLAGNAEYLDALDGGQWQYGDSSVPEVGVTFFAGTFVRHPLTLAAVKAILKELAAQGPALQDGLSQKTADMVSRINEVLERYRVPTRLSAFRSFFYFRFPSDERLASLFYVHLRENNVHILEGFPCFLTTAHSEADIDAIVAAFEAASRAMQQGHFFQDRLADMPALMAPSVAPSGIANDAIVPITEAQREIFLSAMIDDEASCAFNESLTISLGGDLQRDALLAAFGTVAARHEALRACVDRDGEHLLVSDEIANPIDEEDLSNLAPEAVQARIDEILDEEARTPLDLHNGPLARWRLIKVNSERHELVFTAHHIICDGWSINVLINELAALYSAAKAGREATLEPAVSFAAYARSRLQAKNSASGADIEQYWLDRFKDRPLPVDLPTDRPRERSRTSAGATYKHFVGQPLTKECRAFAARHKASLFMILFAGFNALVARLANSRDLTVAVPMAGQAHVDSGSLVGHCVDFLPLRTKLEDTTNFAELLGRSRDVVFDAYEHQSYTYGTLVNALEIKRDPSRLPLTELQFNVEQIGGESAFDGLQIKVETTPKAAVNSDIFVNVIDNGDTLTITCDYNTDLYDEATIERWMKAYEELLTAGTADPDKSVLDLPVDLTDPKTISVEATEEERRVLAQINATMVDYPRGTPTHELFEAQAAKTPERIALTQESASIAYADLNRRANQLARELVERGAAPGSLIGICLSRTPEMIVALLAVMKSGAAYVPIDPTHPADRIAFTLEDAGVSILVTEKNLAARLPDCDAGRLLIDEDASRIAAHGTDNLALSIAPGNPAYVIYTSGSTGRPKGVVVSHQALVNFLCSMASEPGLNEDDVLAAVTTITFDIAGLEIYLPLIVGARVDLVRPEVSRDGPALAKHLIASGATVLQATPATWRLLIDSGWSGDGKLKALCGGEALPRDLATATRSRVGALYNLFGPTETTIWSTLERIDDDTSPIKVGRPIANTQIYVLDESDQLVPIGTEGEIWIGGDGVAEGYHRRPELTDERFRPDHIGEPGKNRLYRTGDLGRFDADGRLEHLGRLDNQIKLRGFRVELGEIEATIQEVPDVQQTHLVADRDNSGSTRLVAFCLTKGTGGATVQEIVDYATAKLPEFMVPVSTVLVQKFPLTLNGKIDNAALLTIEREQRASKKRVEPGTDAERGLVQIVSEILNVDEIGVTDNLFAIGLDSLKVFKIASRAAKEGVSISPRAIMKGRTVRAALAESATDTKAMQGSALQIKPIARNRHRPRTQPVVKLLNGHASSHKND